MPSEGRREWQPVAQAECSPAVPVSEREHPANAEVTLATETQSHYDRLPDELSHRRSGSSNVFAPLAQVPLIASGLPTMSDPHESSSAKEASSAQAIAPTNPVTIESGDLFRGQREILIQHGDEIYRLRIKRNEKMILHK